MCACLGVLVFDRVCVMYVGKMTELTTKVALYRDPKHPFTPAGP